MKQLIIAEKPSAAAKIANALGSPKTKKVGKVRYYEIPGKKIYVGSAVGHLFGLSSSKRGYPVFEVEWKPTYEKSKSSAFTKKYFKVLEKLAKKCDEFVVACDFDVEGEVIGLNIVRFICKQKDAQRMKFSTMTKSDLVEAYRNRAKTLDWGQANAGETRHALDWFFGLNFSKAIVSAVSKAKNKYVPLSIGRVQGPALSILVEREREILKFKPVPYWQIFADVALETGVFQAVHKTGKFWKEGEAKQIYKKVRDKRARIDDVKRSKYKVRPPVPFDLTTLQIEAYRCLGISPKRTLAAAQKLYSSALISYPRTSSQKLPKKLGFKKILGKLGKNPKYSQLSLEVLKTPLNPREGKKNDKAHPAIHPTGNFAKGLKGDSAKLYDLIVKRFFSVFGCPGERESTKVQLSIENEPFILKGIRTTHLGWQAWYMPYAKKKEIELPNLKIGANYDEKTKLEADETKPPKRYTPSSIIRELEKNNLGTKATRSNIIDILVRRGYIEGKSIQVTELGMKVVGVFEKYAPLILSKKLTRELEGEMELIREGKKKPNKTLTEAKKAIIKVCADLDKNRARVGSLLGDAFIETKKRKTTLCSCPKCKKGMMRVIRSRRTKKRFLACNEYPKCKTTWGMPQKGAYKIISKKCGECSAPLVAFYKRGRKPWIICLNPDCPSKEKSENEKKNKSNES